MTKLFPYLIVLLFACNSPTNKDNNPERISVEKQDSIPASKISTKPTIPVKVLPTHLHDTTVIQSEFVLFLLPDSLRFESYAEGEENIYEADSDFGFAISATMDSISKNGKYKSIRTATSDKRYIVIKDCKGCPQTIDRDTINYGLILTSKGKEIRTTTNLHGGNYLYEVDEYFNIGKR